MTDLIDTTEMYLRTIFELQEEGVPALRARIAQRLAHSGPTVSQTVARMERDGLLRVADDRSIELSDEGRGRATRVMRKHRLAERLLLDVIGLEYEDVHAEACRWEHVMSEQVERKILALLRTHAVSPYGNPIPGLAELGVAPDPASGEGDEGSDGTGELVCLAALPASATETLASTVLLARLGEPLQTDRELLAQLKEAGLVCGVVVRVQPVGEDWVIAAADAATRPDVTLSANQASHVFVRPIR